MHTTTGVPFDPFGGGAGTVVTKKLLGTLGNRHEAHDALVLTHEATGPSVEVDPHGLSKTAHNVEGQAESPRCCPSDCLLVFFLLVAFAECFRALECPQEQSGQPGVLFQHTCHAAAHLCFDGAEHLS